MYNILVTSCNGRLGNEFSPVVKENVIYIIIRKNKNVDTINQIHHYSKEGICSWYDFAVAFNEAIDHNCNIKPCHSNEFPSKVTRPSYSVLDNAKIKNALEIEIPYWKDSMIKPI